MQIPPDKGRFYNIWFNLTSSPSIMVQATPISITAKVPSIGTPSLCLSLTLIKPHWILAIVLFLGIFCPVSIFAGGVADFGTVSKSKITLNPAGAAAIDRVLFDITAFQFEQNNTLSTLSTQARHPDGHPADICYYVPDGPDRPDGYFYPGGYDYKVESIKYENGEVTGGHIDLAYPTSIFT
ncbi:MAG: hypothetical protein HQ517_14015, partial [SAR324 cluster bacterium]|nr:hypothetical protein [SAR324 cluster bacterium]